MKGFLSKKSREDAGAILAAVLAGTLFLVGLVISFVSPKVSLTAAEERSVPIYRVDRDDKTVAVSFDAAWGSEKTPEILDILDKYHVRTTFFLVGFWMDAYPERTKEIAARGHEIGNHSQNHPNMPNLSRDEMAREIDETTQKITALTGQTPTLFRPPFGDYDNTLLEVLHEKGYEGIQWSMDSLDWKDIGTDEIVRRVTENVKSGDIILFHNNAEDVTEYLPVILQFLKEEGYSIVPVSELLFDAPYRIDNSGVQHKG